MAQNWAQALFPPGSAQARRGPSTASAIPAMPPPRYRRTCRRVKPEPGVASALVSSSNPFSLISTLSLGATQRHAERATPFPHERSEQDHSGSSGRQHFSLGTRESRGGAEWSNPLRSCRYVYLRAMKPHCLYAAVTVGFPYGYSSVMSMLTSDLGPAAGKNRVAIL